MKLLLESMTKLFVGPYTVRVWRQETLADPPKPFDRSELLELARTVQGQVLNAKTPGYDQWFVAKVFIHTARVNAVEGLDSAQQGCVLYANWP